MIEQQVSTIDYYVWLLSDWAYLGGVRFMQLAARHRFKINYIPMRMQDVYAGSGGILLANRSWQRQAYRITELKRWRSKLGIPLNIEPKFFPCDVDLNAAGNQAVREEYRGNTARALAAGVFGSPFYVFAGELFWGQDRLDMLEGAIVRSAPGNLGRGPG